MSWTPLTQHALGVPGVRVPGADAVLHQYGDVVVHHVGHGVVHGGPEVGLSCGGSTYHIPHLTTPVRDTVKHTIGGIQCATTCVCITSRSYKESQDCG